MAEWNKGKVLPSAINGGQEFTTKDNLAVNELNAIVNNSFYASNISETSIAKADSAVATSKLAEEKIDNFIKTGGDSVVTLNGVPQVTWSADFAEAERQKSKNLFNVFGDYTKGLSYGTANYSVSQDGIIKTTNAYATSNLKGWEIPVKSNTTYTIQANLVSSTEAETRCYYYLYDGTSYTLVSGFDLLREKQLTFTTLDNTKTIVVTFASIYGGESQINNVQVEEGSIATDYQPYNGAIVHEKDIANIDVKYSEVIYDNISKPTPAGSTNSYGNGISISANGVWYDMDFRQFKRVEIIASFNNQQLHTFIDLENMCGDTSYAGRQAFGHDGVYKGELSGSIHANKDRIYAFSTTATTIYRIVGYY